MKIPLFYKKLLSFLIILFLLDFAIGNVLKYFYFRQTSGLLYRTTYAIDSTKADILILGTSTANHHYYPPIFEKELKMSCYNAGRDGNSLFYHYAVLKAVLKRYHPKLILLDIDAGEFQEDQQSYDRLSSLLPYYSNHPEIRSIVQLKGSFEKYKLLSKIYPYNSLLFTVGAGNTEFNKRREGIVDENGYVALNGQWKSQLTINSSPINYDLDSQKVNTFNSMIKDCVDEKIKLFVFISPTFIKYLYPDPSIEIAQKIISSYNIPFYNFSNDTTFLKNGGLFYNEGHLNDEGAKVYSKMVIDKINSD